MRAASWSLGAAAIAVLAGSVRVLPWLLEPDVPWRVALPFARSLVAIAIEAAVMVGFPVGVALECHQFAERGEARVLSLLGERPSRTVARLAPVIALFSAVIALASAAGGLDASAPGRVATDLIEQGRASCAAATEPRSYAVPLVGATWLCGPGRTPRLYGHGPGAMSAVSFTAERAHVAGDMRRIDLDEATLMLGREAESPRARLGVFTLKGLSPWASASTLTPWARAAITSSSAALAALIAAYACLRRFARPPLAALALGAVGPLAALGATRALERIDAPARSFLLVPVAATLAALALAAVLSRVRRRPV